MPTIKRMVVSGLAGGVGFAVAIAIILGIVSWYQSRPKPPKPWDKAAVTATYDSIDTEGQSGRWEGQPPNRLVFYYTLQNNTDSDYQFSDLTNIVVMAKLKRQKSLSGQKGDKFLQPDSPVLIPAKQRIRFALHVGYPYEYDKSLKAGASKKDIEAYVNEKFSNLDGFALFDENNRYQIDFPKGW
jgi:hypothetical protein